jgi:hypothetical protein
MSTAKAKLALLAVRSVTSFLLSTFTKSPVALAVPVAVETAGHRNIQSSRENADYLHLDEAA